jgi:phosphate transport system substrate-binding protein
MTTDVTTTTASATAIVLLLVVTFSGCVTTGGGDEAIYGSASGGTMRSGVIIQEGSSTVLPVAELWAEDFGFARGVQIQVAGGGSGRGASGLCAGELDIGDMSRVIKQSEIEECQSNGINPVQWPVAFDGLSVVVSAKNTFVKDLTVEQLALIFRAQGFAAKWNEVDENFPANDIRLCYPDSDSGTYEYFNEVILDEGAPRTGAGVQQSPNDNVLVNCLADDANAIGYFGYAYYVANTNKVSLVAVEGVKPSEETVAEGTYTPLSRAIYMTTNGIPTGLLRDYFLYGLHPDGGQALVSDTGYVPLDEETRQGLLADLGA